MWLVIVSVPIRICCFHGSVTQSTRWQPGTLTSCCMYCVGSIELSSLLGAMHRSRNVGAGVKERTMLLATLCPGNTLDVLSSRCPWMKQKTNLDASLSVSAYIYAVPFHRRFLGSPDSHMTCSLSTGMWIYVTVFLGGENFLNDKANDVAQKMMTFMGASCPA